MDDFESPVAPRGGSVAGAVLRGLIAAAVVFGVYWVVFGQGADDDLMAVDETPPVLPTTPDAGLTDPLVPPTPTESPGQASPSPTEALPPTGPAEQIGEGLTVQVLSGSDDDRVNAALDVLESLGYQIANTGVARQSYDATTVFATDGFEEEAQALVAADPRFTTYAENPGNLTAEIDIHVVVGTDWPLDDAEGDPAATTTEGA